MLKSYYTEFFTATVLNWQKLLHDDNLKQIIAGSLQWLVKEKRCTVYAFVIRAAVGVPANSSFKPQMNSIIYLHI